MPNCRSTADLVGRSQVMAHNKMTATCVLLSSEGSPKTTPIPQARRLGLAIAGDLTGHRRGGWRVVVAPLDDHDSRRSGVVEVERGRQGGLHAEADRRGRTPRAPVASARSNTTHARQPIVERQRSAAPPALEGRRQNFSPCLNALDSPCVRWPCRRWPNQCKPPASPPRAAAKPRPPRRHACRRHRSAT
jgi:hypothetical protein